MPRFPRIQQGLASLLFLAATAQTACAGDWPQWRGPDLNGTSDEKNTPASVDPQKDVLWSVNMPGESSATPVVVGNRIFVASNGPELEKLFGICIDRDTGEVLWQKQLAEATARFRATQWRRVRP